MPRVHHQSNGDTASNPIQLKTSGGEGANAMEALLAELGREDSGMQRWLLDAAVSGLALTIDSGSAENRERAARAWDAIRPILSHHLLSEEETVLPWAERDDGFSPALASRIRDQHQKLRGIAERISSVAFASDSNARVAEAGRALRDFAVCLDDLIAGEQRELFPAVRRVLFRAAHKHTH